MPEYMRQARDIRRAAIELDAEPPRRWAGPGEVVVSRTDLEAALQAFVAAGWENWPEAARLRAVLNQEGNQ